MKEEPSASEGVERVEEKVSCQIGRFQSPAWVSVTSQTLGKCLHIRFAYSPPPPFPMVLCPLQTYGIPIRSRVRNGLFVGIEMRV